jgi:S1-C subfamily serine protease
MTVPLSEGGARMFRPIPVICLAAVLLSAVILPGTAAGASRMESLDSEITSMVDRISESIVSIAAVSGGTGGPGGGAFVSRSVGTGVVFDEGGLVLTTASVVGYASQVEVRTSTGLQLVGEVVGIDPATDLAVVRVEDLRARPAPISKKKNILPGSLVFVIGNSYGKLPSVTMGVISNAPSPLGEDGGEEMLRMSVPVNPGNTGAPILSAGGEVIGLLVGRLSMQPMSYTMRIREGGVHDFAQVVQPSNMSVGLPAYRLRAIAEEIVEEGGKRPGYLGVRVVEADIAGDEEGGGIETIEGVVVTSVVPGSPAESIGLEAGDIIWRFGSETVLTSASLRDRVSSSAPGSLVNITFKRGSRQIDENVRIASRSPEQLRQAQFMVQPEEIDIRIEMIQREIDRMEKELKRLREAR